MNRQIANKHEVAEQSIGAGQARIDCKDHTTSTRPWAKS
jgi:hypothetical protein